MGNNLEWIRCNLCDAEDGVLIYELEESYRYDRIDSSHHFRILRCPNCGLVYVNPRLSTETLHTLYRDGLPGQIGPDGAVQSQSWAAYQRSGNKRFAFFRSEVQRINSYIQPPGKLLEVGCSYGDFLKTAKDTGWDVYGVELNKLAVSHARALLNLPDHILYSTLEEANFPDGFFRVVVLYQVIEHLTNPLETLREVHRILGRGGLIVATFPNVDSVPRLFQGANWPEFHPVEHLYYFNLPTTKTLLKKTGFLPLDVPARMYGRRESI